MYAYYVHAFACYHSIGSRARVPFHLCSQFALTCVSRNVYGLFEHMLVPKHKVYFLPNYS